MPSPYRLPPVKDLERAAPAALLYPTSDATASTRVAHGVAAVWVFAMIATPALALAGYVELAGFAIVAFIAWTIVRIRRASKRGVLLGVEEGVLTLTDGRRTVLRVRLADLEDVGLDSKSIRKVVPGQDAVPAVRFINSQVGPEIDVARITLSIADQDEPFFLTTAFLPHMDAVEWAGKIRSFLRKQRWLPEDEREERDESQA